MGGDRFGPADEKEGGGMRAISAHYITAKPYVAYIYIMKEFLLSFIRKYLVELTDKVKLGN